VLKSLEIYIDGASKGNPGPSGIGVVICKNQETIKNISSYIGHATNNIAEYTALLYGLQEALKLHAENVAINTDSQLLYRQIKKIYKIKNHNILGLYNQSIHLMSGFKNVSINNIPRQENRGADKLANQAIKNQLKSDRSLIKKEVAKEQDLFR
jgi:ribonuclease HI